MTICIYLPCPSGRRRYSTLVRTLRSYESRLLRLTLKKYVFTQSLARLSSRYVQGYILANLFIKRQKVVREFYVTEKAHVDGLELVYLQDQQRAMSLAAECVFVKEPLVFFLSP